MTSVFEGRVALVTGAASGIGRATAIGFAAEGAQVIMLDIDRDGLEETSARAGGGCTSVLADLAHPDSAMAAARTAIERAGRIDFLANVAGIVRPPDQIANVEAQAWIDLLTVNLVAPAMLMRVASEDMIRRNQGGRIVNVSSSSAFRAQSPACYASAKAGILGLTRTGAAELGPHDINVNAVVPGPTLTPMVLGRAGEFPVEEVVKSGPFANLLGRVSEPEDVSAVILFLCRPESRQVTGQAIHTSAGAVV